MSLNSTSDLELGVDCYATFEAILAHIPHVSLDNSNTKPSRKQGMRMARQVFQEVNSVLKVLGYQIPVVSTNSTGFGYVARMCAVGTAKSIEAAAASVDGRTPDSADFLQKEFDRMWRTLKDGQATLPGAARSNPTRHEGERKPSFAFHAPSGDESGSLFSRDMEW